MGELALPERDVVPLGISQGDDDLLEERQGLVDVGGFFQNLPLRLEPKQKANFPRHVFLAEPQQKHIPY